jgi:fructokinase
VQETGIGIDEDWMNQNSTVADWRRGGPEKKEPMLVVGLGEALFDCFGGCDRDTSQRSMRLGGAPLNFTVHAEQLLKPVGAQAVLASRVGYDKLGDDICRALESRGVDTTWIQRDPETSTGLVHVTSSAEAQGSAPSYEIACDVAWDRLEFDNGWRDLAQRCSAVCFGTLAQRSSTSHAAIHSFLATAQNALRICDMNYRQDFFDKPIIRRSLELANVVKLSEGELEITAAVMGIPQTGRSEDTAQRMRDAFDLSHVAVTRGQRGTLLVSRDNVLEGVVDRPPPAADADGVGAGDACCAGLAVGLLLGWSAEHTLQLANRTGAIVAAHPGGTPQLPVELLQWVRETDASYHVPHSGAVSR